MQEKLSRDFEEKNKREESVRGEPEELPKGRRLTSEQDPAKEAVVPV